MLSTILMAATLALPDRASSADVHLAAAALLRSRLSELDQHEGCAHRFPLLIEAGRDAGAALGGGTFARELAQLVDQERWRALSDPSDAEARLERALTQALSDLEFEPLIEASLPEGFPAPTPVRAIELKSYPAYRLARAPMGDGSERGAFFALFRHIQARDIPMTAPVEMTYAGESGRLREVDMAFMYEHPRQGSPGVDGRVEVVDVAPLRVVSLGCRGRSSDAAIEEARALIMSWIASRDDLEITGELRQLGYNSPMVPGSRRYFEVQVPVREIEPPEPRRVVIDFLAEEESARWRPVDDVVMGGVSSSRLVRSDDGYCLFTGEVSLENNGGFASVRSDRADLELGGLEALTLRLRGDGKTYRLRLRTSDGFDVMSYQASFATEDGVWMERTFRFEEFVPTWRGRRIPDAPELDPQLVRGLGLSIADEQAGPFRLELESLQAGDKP